MEDLASPLGAFLRDCCEVGAGKSAGIEELFSAWEVWCRGQRRDWTGDKQSFGRDLRAALPEIKTSRPRTPQGERQRLYEGVAVKDPVAALDVQEIRWSEHQGAGRKCPRRAVQMQPPARHEPVVRGGPRSCTLLVSV